MLVDSLLVTSTSFSLFGVLSVFFFSDLTFSGLSVDVEGRLGMTGSTGDTFSGFVLPNKCKDGSLLDWYYLLVLLPPLPPSF